MDEPNTSAVDYPAPGGRMIRGNVPRSVSLPVISTAVKDEARAVALDVSTPPSNSSAPLETEKEKVTRQKKEAKLKKKKEKETKKLQRTKLGKGSKLESSSSCVISAEKRAQLEEAKRKLVLRLASEAGNVDDEEEDVACEQQQQQLRRSTSSSDQRISDIDDDFGSDPLFEDESPFSQNYSSQSQQVSLDRRPSHPTRRAPPPPVAKAIEIPTRVAPSPTPLIPSSSSDATTTTTTKTTTTTTTSTTDTDTSVQPEVDSTPSSPTFRPVKPSGIPAQPPGRPPVRPNSSPPTPPVHSQRPTVPAPTMPIRSASSPVINVLSASSSSVSPPPSDYSMSSPLARSQNTTGSLDSLYGLDSSVGSVSPSSSSSSLSLNNNSRRLSESAKSDQLRTPSEVSTEDLDNSTSTSDTGGVDGLNSDPELKYEHLRVKVDGAVKQILTAVGKLFSAATLAAKAVKEKGVVKQGRRSTVSTMRHSHSHSVSSIGSSPASFGNTSGTSAVFTDDTASKLSANFGVAGMTAELSPVLVAGKELNEATTKLFKLSRGVVNMLSDPRQKKVYEGRLEVFKAFNRRVFDVACMIPTSAGDAIVMQLFVVSSKCLSEVASWMKLPEDTTFEDLEVHPNLKSDSDIQTLVESIRTNSASLQCSSVPAKDTFTVKNLLNDAKILMLALHQRGFDICHTLLSRLFFNLAESVLDEAFESCISAANLAGRTVKKSLPQAMKRLSSWLNNVNQALSLAAAQKIAEDDFMESVEGIRYMATHINPRPNAAARKRGIVVPANEHSLTTTVRPIAAQMTALFPAITGGVGGVGQLAATVRGGVEKLAEICLEVGKAYSVSEPILESRVFRAIGSLRNSSLLLLSTVYVLSARVAMSLQMQAGRSPDFREVNLSEMAQYTSMNLQLSAVARGLESNVSSLVGLIEAGSNLLGKEEASRRSNDKRYSLDALDIVDPLLASGESSDNLVLPGPKDTSGGATTSITKSNDSEDQQQPQQQPQQQQELSLEEIERDKEREVEKKELENDVSIWNEQREEGVNISYRQEGSEREVKGATLNILVGHLTSADCDDMFLGTFMTTYRSFTTPYLLFHKLIQRYTVPEAMRGSEAMTVIQQGVLTIMMRWLQSCYFHLDARLFHVLERFLEVARRDGHSIADILWDNLQQKREMNAGLRVSAVVKPIETSAAVTSFLPSDFLLEKPQTIAEQLTLLEFELYQNVQPSELLNQSWNKIKYHHRAPTLRALVARFNRVSAWVASAVLWPPDVKTRASVITTFIEVGIHLRNEHNFNALMAILAGLAHSSVHRLKSTFALVKQKHIDDLEDMRDLMSSNQSFKMYRATIDTCPSPCIPYLGVYLTDLTFIEDGNPDFLTDSSFINIQKRKLIYEVIVKVVQFQHTPFAYDPDPKYTSMLTVLPHNSDDDLYHLSLLREPRKRQ